jgi:hypothetical protein
MIEENTLVKKLEQFQLELLALIDPLSEVQWGWSPAPRQWSIAQCIDHINTVNGLVVPRIEAAIEQAAEQGLRASGPFRYPLFDRLFVFALEPRAPVKQQAPGIYRPKSDGSKEEIRERFLDLQNRLTTAARRSQGMDLVRVKIPSPVSPLLRFSLGTWLDAMMAHEQNHFEQAHRVRKQPGFPM